MNGLGFQHLDISLKVVTIWSDIIYWWTPFLCFGTVDFIEVGGLVDLHQSQTRAFFNQFCRVLTYGSDIPINGFL